MIGLVFLSSNLSHCPLFFLLFVSGIICILITTYQHYHPPPAQPLLPVKIDISTTKHKTHHLILLYPLPVLSPLHFMLSNAIKTINFYRKSVQTRLPSLYHLNQNKADRVICQFFFFLKKTLFCILFL